MRFQVSLEPVGTSGLSIAFGGKVRGEVLSPAVSSTLAAS